MTAFSITLSIICPTSSGLEITVTSFNSASTSIFFDSHLSCRIRISFLAVSLNENSFFDFERVRAEPVEHERVRGEFNKSVRFGNDKRQIFFLFFFRNLSARNDFRKALNRNYRRFQFVREVVYKVGLRFSTKASASDSLFITRIIGSYSFFTSGISTE